MVKDNSSTGGMSDAFPEYGVADLATISRDCLCNFGNPKKNEVELALARMKGGKVMYQRKFLQPWKSFVGRIRLLPSIGLILILFFCHTF